MTYGLLLSADSVDFMVHGIFSYSFFGHEVWITTTHVSILMVMLILTVFAIIAGKKFKAATETGEMVPGPFQNAVELLLEFLSNTVTGAMGKGAPKFNNYISTLFLFILLSNISGLLGLRPPTADYGVTFPLALITFAIIHYSEIRFSKPLDLWKDKCSPLPPWLPIWLPINLISDLAVPVSLSLRLFANVLSGTVMMALIYGLLRWIAIGWPAALHVYFDLFSGAIQTYVFCMLTMTYISSARGDAN
ncbi:MAG: F0F1 ATP synthase subunit A [Lachnospiraceae bacterium]|nr:F0F1 ATP synthase subunit A [Lachnospiraceae bacterium]MCR5476671.1 F0F1 ATP synthase subunit A [Lachnospiraceae bacterium]